MFGGESFAAVQAFQKVEVPIGAAELAVGGAPQAHLGLLGDQRLDGSVLHPLQLCGVDLAVVQLGARLFQRGGTQQTADMVGAKRRDGSLHSIVRFPFDCK